VWLRYGRRRPWVLTDDDVSLAAGEVARVLGGNGAGKTTLPSAAAGLLRPARGGVLGRPTTIGWVRERFPATQP
jgi:ABC-type Mn2+/Zn2+ transport system ATPase subunit